MDYKLLEQQIRDNSENLHAYVNSFHKWEEEMRKKDEELIRLQSEERIDEDNVEKGEDDKILKHKKADLHKEKGNIFVKEGKWQNAINEYTISIKLYPDDAAYYGNRSFCNFQLKLWQAAEYDCDRALELKPDYIKVILRRATIRKKLGNIHGAAKDYNLVLILDPKNSTARKEYEELYPELKNHLSKIGINLPGFIEMNSTKTSQEDDSKQTDDCIIDKIGKNIKAKANSLSSNDSKCVIKDPVTKNSAGLSWSNIFNRPNNEEEQFTKTSNDKQLANNSLKCLEEKSGKFGNYTEISPILNKLAHLRSTKPLRRIRIVDLFQSSDADFVV